MTPLHRLYERLSPLGRGDSRGELGIADRVAAPLRLPVERAFLYRVGALRALEQLGASVAGVAPPLSGPRVLVLCLRSLTDHAVYEMVIAHGLRLRGADVRIVRCGGGQPACEIGWARRVHPRPCDRCAWHTGRVAASTRLPSSTLASALPWGADATRAPLAPDPATEAPARALSRISTAWFLRSSDPAGEPDGAAAAADFAVATQGVSEAVRRLLDAHEPDIVFATNGLFAAERVTRAEALRRGLRAPTYEIAPRSGALVFSQSAPAPDYDNDDAWAQVRDRPLTARQRADVLRLLDDRAHGVGAHEVYFAAQEESADALRDELAIPADDRIVSLFTNLSWDSATIDKDVGFASMFEWVCAAVQAIDGVDGTTLVVRVHPAETRWRSRESTEAFVRARFPRLPAKLRFIGPDRALSTYALVELSDLACVYTTTVGLEAASRGVRVAVAGRTHYAQRGFTDDVAGPEELAALIRDAGRGPLSDAQRELALRYAYTFFYRCSIPFPLVRSVAGRVRDAPTSAAQIEPGADPRLDWICERILDGGSFVLPDELAARA